LKSHFSDKNEEYEETAAWLEYVQGNSREEAERLAKEIVYGDAVIPRSTRADR